MKTGKYVCGKFKINLDPLNETKAKLKRGDKILYDTFFHILLHTIYRYVFLRVFNLFFSPATDAKYQ